MQPVPLTTACRAGDRRHHRAWFTDVASLIIGPATTGGDVSDGADADIGVDTDDDVDTDRSPLHRGARPGRAVRTVPDRDGDRVLQAQVAAALEPEWEAMCSGWIGRSANYEHHPIRTSTPPWPITVGH